MKCANLLYCLKDPVEPRVGVRGLTGTVTKTIVSMVGVTQASPNRVGPTGLRVLLTTLVRAQQGPAVASHGEILGSRAMQQQEVGSGSRTIVKVRELY